MTREQWRRAYRMLRIVRRETRKAVFDMTVYGTGVVVFPIEIDLVEPHHVPFVEWIDVWKDVRAIPAP